MSSLLRLSLLFKRSPIDLRPIVALQFVTSIIRVVINLLHAAASSASSTVSKSYRLLQVAREIIEARPGMELEVLDLSRLASEYGRNIHPCKACFSTAPALCHWPCSCYPNYSLGQTQDWMNDIYTVGGVPWHHDCHASELVSSDVAPQAYDGSTRMRRWR